MDPVSADGWAAPGVPPPRPLSISRQAPSVFVPAGKAGKCSSGCPEPLELSSMYYGSTPSLGICQGSSLCLEHTCHLSAESPECLSWPWRRGSSLPPSLNPLPTSSPPTAHLQTYPRMPLFSPQQNPWETWTTSDSIWHPTHMGQGFTWSNT